MANATKKQWNGFKFGLVLILTIIAVLVEWDRSVPVPYIIATGVVGLVITGLLFAQFAKRTDGFDSRHTGGGSSVK